MIVNVISLVIQNIISKNQNLNINKIKNYKNNNNSYNNNLGSGIYLWNHKTNKWVVKGKERKW